MKDNDINNALAFVREMFKGDGTMLPASFVDNSDSHMFYYDNMKRVAVLEFAQYLEAADPLTMNLVSTVAEGAEWSCAHYEEGYKGMEFLYDVNGKDYLYMYMYEDYSFNLYSVRQLSEHPYLRGL